MTARLRLSLVLTLWLSLSCAALRTWFCLSLVARVLRRRYSLDNPHSLVFKASVASFSILCAHFVTLRAQRTAVRACPNVLLQIMSGTLWKQGHNRRNWKKVSRASVFPRLLYTTLSFLLRFAYHPPHVLFLLRCMWLH